VGIALDDEHVYWSSGRQLLRAPKSGGTPDVYAPSDMSWGILVDAGVIYWTVALYGEVRSVPTRGGAFTMLAKTSENLFALAHDADNLYWLASNGGITPSMVMQMPKSGGTPSLAGSAEGRALGQLAARDGVVFWTSSVGLHRRSSSEEIETVFPQSAQALTIDNGGSIYFSGAPQFGLATSVIFRTSLSGGAIEPLLDVEERVSDIIVDDESIYFATGSFGSYRIWRVPKTGGNPSCISALVRSLGFLALDANTLYWTEPAGGDGIMAWDLPL
jgi:hypothetical protein